MRDRGGELAASAATVLDQHGERDLGGLHRRERDEPGMVAAAPRAAIRAAQRHGLRGARLARHLDAADAGRLAGAPIGHDDVPHAGANLGQGTADDPRLAEHVGLDSCRTVPSGAMMRFTYCGR